MYPPRGKIDHFIPKAGLRYLFTHPWQTFLSSIGIMLGVAVILSIDIANESSGKAFDISMESVTGKTTHRLLSRQGDIDLSTYIKLRTEAGITISAPVIEENVKILIGNGYTATFLGLDPFSEREFRNFISADLTGDNTELSQLLSSNNKVLIPESFAREAKLTIGDTLSLKWGDGVLRVVCAGLIKSNEDVSGNRIEQFLISDIETARKLFNKGNFVSHIDLILTPSEVERITKTILSNPTLQLSTAEKSNETAKSMTEAFRLNLNAMSLLALIVGLFLIYNAMTFSVVQRRRLLALLRAAGVTQKDIFIQVMAESIFIASIGTIGGIVGGIFLGKIMLGL
ncbi:MAG: ABC transporter permease [Ignavibacteriales bacterium]|nr:ABC transporter permease [Ignavibacteriales bacterium]